MFGHALEAAAFLCAMTLLLNLYRFVRKRMSIQIYTAAYCVK